MTDDTAEGRADFNPMLFVEQMVELTAAVERLARSYKIGKFFIVALVTLLIGVVPLTGYLVYQNHRINDVQAVQLRTNREALCPLYGLFLSTYRPDEQPKDKRVGYEASFKVIRDGATALGVLSILDRLFGWLFSFVGEHDEEAFRDWPLH